MPQRPVDRLRLIKKEIKASFEWSFQELAIPQHLRSHLYRSNHIDVCAEARNKGGEFRWDALGVDFYLIPFQKTSRGPFVLSLPRERNYLRVEQGKRKPGKCFVGCRYDAGYPKLREVLESILGYYGYEVPPPVTGSGQILDDIIDQLHGDEIAFAIFDNRATTNKPNVYIELGIAYTLNKPLMLFQHRTTVLPADLGGFSALQYSDYRDFARQLSLHLPRFLREKGIPPPWERTP